MASKLARKVSSHFTAALVGAAVSYYAVQQQDEVLSVLKKQGIILEHRHEFNTINTREVDGDDRKSTRRPEVEVAAVDQIQMQSDVKSKRAIQVHQQRQQSSKSKSQSLNVHNSSPIVKSPLTIFNPNPNLEIAFDARTKNPIYVLERFPPQNVNGTDDDENDGRSKNKVTRGNQTFYEEKTIPEYHRSRNGYYRKSGYDRGHMAAAANFKHDEGQMRDTFSLSNISPQTPVMNRIVWSRLENLVRTMIKNGNDNPMRTRTRVGTTSGDGKDNIDHVWYIVSGPMWLPGAIVKDDTAKDRRDLFQYMHLGFGSPPGLVQVPTHFFKVVFATDPQERIVSKFAAFVIPNNFFKDDANTDRVVNLEKDFLVRLTDIEAVTGISFFPSEEQEQYQEIHEALDLITEQMWMGVSRQSSRSGIDTTLQDKGRHERTLVMGDAKVSKSRVNAIGKKLRKLKNNGIEPLPKHLCAGGLCNIDIRIRKPN